MMFFDEMRGATTYFSTFDAVDGFWQVPMAPEDVEKTAFTTQMGAYEWLVMPQGLQNSSSQYQRRMQRALGHLPFVRVLIDDVCVYTRGAVEEHYSATDAIGVALGGVLMQDCGNGLKARWYMDLVEVGVPRMEYAKGALLLVPDALSRRPDYVSKSPREGLKEAGVLDDKSDMPKTSLAAMNTSSIFEEGPSKSYPAWHAEQEAYLHAVDTLQIAEKAMEATLAFKVGGIAKVSSRAHDTQTTQQKSGELERTLRRSTRSQVLRAKEGVKTPLLDATSEGGEVDIKTKVSKRGKTQDRRSVPSALKGGLEKDQRSEAQKESAEASLPSQRQQRKSVRFQAIGLPGKRVRQEVFDRIQAKYGNFDVDACCDEQGNNRRVKRFWHNCLQEKWRGLYVCWCEPSFSGEHLTVEALLLKYVQEWRCDPEHTSAVFLLPDIQSRMPQWRSLFRRAGMRVEEVIPTHDAQGEPLQLMEGPNGQLMDLQQPMLVVHAPPSKQQRQLATRADIKRWSVFYEGSGGGMHTKMWETGLLPVKFVRRHLTEKLMDRSLCRKPSKRWHGPVAVTERFYSDLQAEMPEADRGAPVAYRLKLPPHLRVHDVFAQHRLKPYTGGEDTFALRQWTLTPEAVVVDGQKEAHVEKFLSRGVRVSRGKEIEEWKVRWTGFSKAHDQWSSVIS
eukprot:gene7313-biopygen7394